MQLLQTADEDAELSRQLAGSPASPAASLLGRRTPPTSPQRLTSLQQEPGSPRSPRGPVQPATAQSQALAVGAAGQPQPAAAGQQQSTIEIAVSAVGVGLQFVHLDSGSGGAVRSLPGTRPGSGLSSQHASAADLGRAASQQLAARPSQAALAAAAVQQAVQQQLPPKSVQLLAAYLDIQADYRIEVTGCAALSWRGVCASPGCWDCLAQRAAVCLGCTCALSMFPTACWCTPSPLPNHPMSALAGPGSERAGGGAGAAGGDALHRRWAGLRRCLLCLMRLLRLLCQLHDHHSQQGHCAAMHAVLLPPLPTPNAVFAVQMWQRAWRSVTSRTLPTSAR